MTTTVKTLLAVLGVTLAVFAGLGFFFWQIRSINQEAATVERRVEDLSQRRSEFQSIRSDLENNADSIDRLDSYLVPEDGVPAFLSDIEALSDTTGASVTIDSVKTQSLPESEIASSLRIKTEIVGRWSEVFHTISLLETMPLKLKVDILNLTRSDNNTKPVEEEEGEEGTTGQGIPTWTGVLELSVLKRVSL